MNFEHGGDIYSFAKKLDCNISDIVDLSSNINFIKPNLDIDFNSLNISSYPNYNSLKDAISNNYNISIDNFELYNGASVAIYSLLKRLKYQDIVLYAPIYLEYKKFASLNGYNIKYIDRFNMINEDIPFQSLVVFVNPSTPDGAFYNIDTLINRWIEREATIIIDESFLDFTPYKSAIEYINRYDKIYIIKSMTKFYSSAGIRVGLVISNIENIIDINRDEPLWKISEFDSKYLEYALKDKKFANISRDITQKNRELLIKILKKYREIEKIYPSTTNYILIKLRYINAIEFQNRLIPYKIMVRDCWNFDFLDNNFIRVAIKDIESINSLENALNNILSLRE